MPKYELAKRPGFPNWYVVWSEHGRSRRRTTGTPDRGEAQAFYAAFVTELERAPAFALAHADRQLRLKVRAEEDESVFATTIGESVESRVAG